MSKRQQNKKIKRSVFERDDGLCGKHLGGCGEPIEAKPTDYNLYERDHIIPKGYFEKAPWLLYAKHETHPYEWFWNSQPMHPECHKEKKDKLKWPRFMCSCHFLRIEGDSLFIYYKVNDGVWRKKLFQTPVIRQEEPQHIEFVRVSSRIMDGKSFGVVFEEEGIAKEGYCLPVIFQDQISLFNAGEKDRILTGKSNYASFPVLEIEKLWSVRGPYPGKFSKNEGPKEYNCRIAMMRRGDVKVTPRIISATRTSVDLYPGRQTTKEEQDAVVEIFCREHGHGRSVRLGSSIRSTGKSTFPVVVYTIA